MSGPAVVIALPGGSEAVSVRDLVDACTEHLRLPGGCAVWDRGAVDAAARAVAIVSWKSQQWSARVQVGIRGQDQPTWPSTELTFQPGDALAERSKAIGLAIATLVGEATAPPSVTAEAAPSASPASADPWPPAAFSGEPSQEPVTSRTAEKRFDAGAQATAGGMAAVTPRALEPATGASAARRAWVDLAGVTFSGATWGGAVRGLIEIDKTHWRGIGSAAYAGGTEVNQETTLTLSRFQAAVGAAFAGEFEATAPVEGHLEVVLDWLHADAGDPLLGEDRASRVTGALALGASAGLWLARPLGLFVGTDLIGHVDGTEIRAGNRTVARLPALDWSALVGVRLGVD